MDYSWSREVEVQKVIGRKVQTQETEVKAQVVGKLVGNSDGQAVVEIRNSSPAFRVFICSAE
jgi:hypothetical protein